MMNWVANRNMRAVYKTGALLLLLFVVALGYQLYAQLPERALQTMVKSQEQALETAGDQVAAQEPLARFVKEREVARQMQLAQLDELISGVPTDQQIHRDAARQKLTLLSWIEQEVTLEGILRARGFSDAVVSVHTGSVNVMVRTQALSQAQSAQILDLVCRETGQTSGNVKIIPVE